MTPDELRERIRRQGGEPLDNELLWQLRGLPSVRAASSDWFHGWVQITVALKEWTWDAMQEPTALIDAFAREHVQQFSVTHRFTPPKLTPPGLS